MANSQDPCLSTSASKTDVHQARASTSWAHMMDTDSPLMPPLFDEPAVGELGDEDAEDDANSDFLDMVEIEEEVEDNSTFPPQQSRSSGAADVASLADIPGC